MRKIILLFAILLIGTSVVKAQSTDVAGAKSKLFIISPISSNGQDL